MTKRCDHGRRWAHCDNNWCRLKIMVAAHYADLANLPFYHRWWATLTEIPAVCTETWQTGRSTISQTYRTIHYRGVTYFYKWGPG